MSVNTNIAKALGMEPMEEEKRTVDNVPVVIEPHETELLSDPTNPNMIDIERSTLEAEKTLDGLIDESEEFFATLYDMLDSVPPAARASFIEKMNQAFDNRLKAVKMKMDGQHKKKENRLKEAERITKLRDAAVTSPSVTNNTVNNTHNTQVVFKGSREELMKFIESDGKS